MFKNLKLAGKMALGFGVLIVIAAVLGFMGWNSLGQVDRRVVNADDANWMIKQLYQGRVQEKNFIMRQDEKSLENSQELAKEFTKRAEQLDSQLRDAADKTMVKNLNQNMEKWLAALTEFVSLEKQKDAADAKMVENARAVVSEVEKIRADQKVKLEQEIAQGRALSILKDRLEKADDANRLIKYCLECRQQEKNFIIRKDHKYVEEVDKRVAAILTLCDELKVRFKDALNDNQVDVVISSIKNYQYAYRDFVDLVGKQDAEEEVMVQVARGVIDEANELRTGQKDKMQSLMASSNLIMISLAVGGVILGVLLAFFITKSIVGPINKIIEGLSGGSEQVASASEQLSSTSQSMSEGSSEQASSLEEVSSSLEEMSSMTKQNAQNAKQANTLSTDASGAAQQSKDAMVRMSEAIDKIKNSSDETAKIIKTIDEIAMQTNLLALNAAVEAARAGEAGRGFAVVAEEVRNLAQRSAEAAKSTAELIEGSQKNSENGVTASAEVTKIVEQIIESIQKVAQLIAEVSAASDEQSQGIDQVNTAVAEMDKVTQQNAANSEESASASEELSSQAQNLNAMVEELINIVGRTAKKGNGSTTGVHAVKQKGNVGPASHFGGHAAHQVTGLSYHDKTGRKAGERRKTAGNGGKEKLLVTAGGREVSPEQVIPLDDDKDLKEF